jgi:hypothetical protein
LQQARRQRCATVATGPAATLRHCCNRRDGNATQLLQQARR